MNRLGEVGEWITR